MDEEGWGYNAQGRVALQEIHRAEAGFPAHVGQVLKVPAHEVFDTGDLADGDMPRIVVKGLGTTFCAR